MALVSYVFQQDMGANHEGDVVSLEPEAAQALIDGGYLAEATQEDLEGQEEEEAPVDAAEEDAPEAATITRAINAGFKQLEKQVLKATEKQLAKGLKTPNVSVPATVKEPVFKSVGALVRARYWAGKGNFNARRQLDAWQQDVRRKSPAGANETTSAQGGYAVIPEWTDDIFSKVKNIPDLLSMTDRQTIGGNTLNIPAVNETSLVDGSRGGGILAYWVTEGNTATTSYPQLTQVLAVINTQVVLVPLTNQLLEDNAFNLDQFIAKKVGEEFMFQAMVAVINGTGSGQPKGIMNQASLVSVAKESGQSSATIVFPNLAKMWGRLYPPSRNNALWLMNPACYQQLLQMTFPSASGTYPAFGFVSWDAHDEFPLRIFGRPAVECLSCPALGAAGDIILADLSQLTCAEHPGLQVDVSDQVYFASLQTVFRFVRRYDVQSPWTAALTDYNGGSNTYSPFVTIASRGT